jgi:hypothetical protein
MKRRDWKGGVNPRRRRFLAVLVGTLVSLPALGATARRCKSRQLSLHEADFYRPHDLEG